MHEYDPKTQSSNYDHTLYRESNMEFTNKYIIFKKLNGPNKEKSIL